MQIYNSSNEYDHLVGRQLYHKPTGIKYTIQKITEYGDSTYRRTSTARCNSGVRETSTARCNSETDNHAGNAYCIYIGTGTTDNIETFHFRHFSDVVQKYGELVAVSTRRIPHKSVIRFPQVVPTNKWSKVYPET